MKLRSVLRSKTAAIFFTLTALIIAGYVAVMSKSAYRNSPNIILISVDTLRPDHLGVYGYPQQTSPFMDSFINGSISASDMTTVFPVTSPSFAALFTGRHPFTKKLHDSGSYAVSAEAGMPTLPLILKDRGYKTAAFVTNRILWKDFFNIADGFDEYYQTESFPRDGYIRFLEHARGWLERTHEKPFFWWVHFMDPHSPYDPPDTNRCLFDTASCEDPGSPPLTDLEETRESPQGCSKVPHENAVVSRYTSLYDAEIRTADDMIRTVYETITARGLDKNTIIILYSDHGEGFDHQYYYEHGDVLYRSGTRILFALKSPYIKNSSRISVPLQNMDILPTLLDLLGIPSAGMNLDGISFAAFFRQDPVSWYRRSRMSGRYLYGITADADKFSVTDGTYKYIYSLEDSCLNQGKTEELYNLKTDPSEQQDLSGKNAEVYTVLKNRQLKSLNRYGFLDRNPATPSSGAILTPDQQDALEKLRSLGY